MVVPSRYDSVAAGVNTKHILVCAQRNLIIDLFHKHFGKKYKIKSKERFLNAIADMLQDKFEDEKFWNEIIKEIMNKDENFLFESKTLKIKKDSTHIKR